jgi:putative flippase GtrA
MAQRRQRDMRVGMSLGPRLRALQLRLVGGWRSRAVSLKAISFALVGVVNTMVDYSVFLAARSALQHAPQAQALFDSLSVSCNCASPTTIALIAANIVSWTVAVSGSYVMNSSITFAAESGRKLRWGAYLTFIASGVLGWFANTATLVFAAQVLLFPVWIAKAVAIFASFIVNFSLSHFVVFRVRPGPAVDLTDEA